VWFLDGQDGKKSTQRCLLDEVNSLKLEGHSFPVAPTNFFRSDDVSATAHFYMDKPENNLAQLPSVELRLKDLKMRVWDKLKPKE
jgi:hypothetical protein